MLRPETVFYVLYFLCVYVYVYAYWYIPIYTRGAR